MKQLLLITFLVFCGITVQAQINVTQTDSGNYEQIKKIHAQLQPTARTFTDLKGNVYPVYKSASGKLFVIRTSKKTGKQYKSYLKL